MGMIRVYLINFLPLFLLVIPLSVYTQKSRKETKNLTEYVNPFTGTAGSGSIFPGATYPRD